MLNEQYQMGYNDAVEKAYKWLCNADIVWLNSRGILEETFKKAMES